MPSDELTILQSCGVCGTELGTFSIKKDNMMLISKELMWCPSCQADRPEVRELVGRRNSIQKEIESYAANLAVDAAAVKDHGS